MIENQNNGIGEFAPVAIKLLQGTLYDGDKSAWKDLVKLKIPLKKYFGTIGIDLVLNETEGYAYLSQLDSEEMAATIKIPRLVRKLPVSYDTTILLVILRDILEEHDTKPTYTQKCFVFHKDIKDRASIFFRDKANKTRFYNDIDDLISKANKLNFLKEVNNGEGTKDEKQYEVKRIIKAKISISVLEEIKRKMENINEKMESNGAD